MLLQGCLLHRERMFVPGSLWLFPTVRTGFDGGGSSLCQNVDTSPYAIIVCGDSARSFYWYLDCSAAAQNILLAAESMGLGAVWTAAYPYEDRMEVVRKYTHLPENILPLCVILSAILQQKSSRNRNMTRKRYIIISISKQKFCLFNKFLTFAA